MTVLKSVLFSIEIPSADITGHIEKFPPLAIKNKVLTIYTLVPFVFPCDSQKLLTEIKCLILRLIQEKCSTSLFMRSELKMGPAESVSCLEV